MEEHEMAQHIAKANYKLSNLCSTFESCPLLH